MSDVEVRLNEDPKISLKHIARFVVASSVFKRNLVVYGFVIFGMCPLLVLSFHFWSVDSEQSLMTFTTQKLLPAMILLSAVAAAHLVFQAYVTAREYVQRKSEYESYDAFCETRWKELGRHQGFVSFPLRFLPGFLGMFVFTLSVITIFNHIFE